MGSRGHWPDHESAQSVRWNVRSLINRFIRRNVEPSHSARLSHGIGSHTRVSTCRQTDRHTDTYRYRQEAQLSLGSANRTAYIRRPASDFRPRKETDFSEWLQSHTHYGDAATSNATINARIWYANLAHMGDGCRLQLCIQNRGQTVADRNMLTTDSL